MNEKPLERLNYYNGQRLEASDFKTEQDYHMRIRRWLNKSLYSAGIGSGLEVSKVLLDDSESPRVTVSPGLALDDDGREIILIKEVMLEVCSNPGSRARLEKGNYLVVEYTEETIAYEKGGCAVRAAGTSSNKSTTNWSGPSRIQAQVKFSWVPFVPHPGSNQIVLAWVVLDDNCTKILQIERGVRHYIGTQSAAMVRQYALEGEREVACLPIFDHAGRVTGQTRITARIYFHARGRQPNGVTLYLKAEEFSRLHYTEMGQHKHIANVSGLQSTEQTTSIDPHSHTHSFVVNLDSHTHPTVGLIAWPVLYDPTTGGDANKDGRGYYSIHPGGLPSRTYSEDLKKWVGLTILPEGDYHGGHKHVLVGSVGSVIQPPASTSFHTHPLRDTLTASVENAGVTNPSSNHSYSARVGAPLSFFNNLQIAVDGVDRTGSIVDQIIDTVAGDAQKDAWEQKLGNGKSNHPLVDKAIDAVPIRLDYLPQVSFSEGQHVIEFSVGLTPEGDANGGKIHYNLYIE